MPAIENEFMSQLAYYVEMSARARGYNIMLCNSEPDLKQEEMVVKLLLGRRVDGILIVPQSPATYEKIAPLLEQIPAVFLSENLRDQPQSYVSVDNSRGAYLGVEYLYGLGHREILYFGCRNSTTHQLRAEGYLRACRQFGLEPRLHHSDFARSSIENGYQMVKELFAKPIDYTAIFASTDSNALGILKAADELHIRIPGICPSSDLTTSPPLRCRASTLPPLSSRKRKWPSRRWICCWTRSKRGPRVMCTRF